MFSLFFYLIKLNCTNLKLKIDIPVFSLKILHRQDHTDLILLFTVIEINIRSKIFKELTSTIKTKTLQIVKFL